MRLIDGYIRNTVLLAMGLVLLILAGLDLVFTLFDEIGDTNERYGALDALHYVVHVMPRRIYELLPMSSLLGALIGLGALASNNELVVMQSVGVRVSRIVWAVMKPTAVVMVLSLLLGEFVAPAMELRGELRKSVVNGQEMVGARGGHWFKDGRQFVHANAIEAGGVLHNISVYEFDEQRRPELQVSAKRAVYREEKSSDQRWLFEEAIVTRFERPSDGGGLISHQKRHASLAWPLGVEPDLLEILVIDSDKMAISDLYRYAHYFRGQGQDASDYFLQFWRKLLQPLTTAVLVLVAVSFIFGPLREATMGSRLFAAICFGLFFIILQRLLNTISLVYQLDPLVAVLLPVLLSAGAGYYLLWRAS